MTFRSPLKRFVQQGRRGFGARGVHEVREGERREERQVCEREARQSPENAAARPFGSAQGKLFQGTPIRPGERYS